MSLILYLTSIGVMFMALACTNQTMHMHPNTSIKSAEMLLDQQQNITKASAPLKQRQRVARLGIVLLHGLYAQADELLPIAQKIADLFGDAVLVIQPTCRASWRSVIYSIDSQSKNVIQHIQDTLVQHNKDPLAFPIILIGYSHGGVLACHLGQNYQDQFKHHGIITICAPLMGTPLLERTSADVDTFLFDAQHGLQLINCPPSNIQQQMSLSAWLLTLIRPRWVPLLNGLKSINPSSKCVQGVYHFLRKGSHQIPCLLIAGHQNDFGKLFATKLADKNQPLYHSEVVCLNHAYAKLVTGCQRGLHDTLIPLRSQLGRSNSLDDLSLITDQDLAIMPMPQRPNIEGHIYKDITHAGNLIVLNDGLFVDTDQHVLYSEQVHNSIVQFIKQRLTSASS